MSDILKGLEQLVTEDWQKVNQKDKTSGMSRKAVTAYRRENPGSKLQTAVTTKPSKLKKGSKAAKRRKSFCARMSGMKKTRASSKTKKDPNSPINKALRRWNCESVQQLENFAMVAEDAMNLLKTEQQMNEDLHKWFQEKWVRFNPQGKIMGPCARGDDSEGKPKCLPQSKAHNLGKKGRASAAARKRREDPNPERSGKAINVNTKKNTNESSEHEGPALGTKKAIVKDTKTPTVMVQIFKHNTLRGDSYWVTKEVRTFKTIEQARAYAKRINEQNKEITEEQLDDIQKTYMIMKKICDELLPLKKVKLFYTEMKKKQLSNQ